MGGDYVYSYVKGAWNVDLIEGAAKIATGMYIKNYKREAPRKYIIGKDFQSDNSGVVTVWDVDDELEKQPYFDEIFLYKKVGDQIHIPPAGYETLGWLTVTGKNQLDVRSNLEEAMKMVNYKVAKFDLESYIGRTLRKDGASSATIEKQLVASIPAPKIEKIKKEGLKNLHVGVACNVYNGSSLAEKELLKMAKEVQDVLEMRGFRVSVFDFNHFPKALDELKTADVDLAFNIANGINAGIGTKPHTSAIFDMLQIPYTGSGVDAFALALNKIRFKKILAYHEIPTPAWDYAYSLEDEIDEEEIDYPMIVKPGHTDKLIGIGSNAIVHDRAELQTEIGKIIKGMKMPALVEEYIEGDEFIVCIIGNTDDDIQVLPLMRTIFAGLPQDSPHIYTNETKWKHGLEIPAPIQCPPKHIPKRVASLITEIALDTYNILDCHDYGIVKVRVDEDDNPYVISIDPNPSLFAAAHMPQAAMLSGMKYPELIETIIKTSIRRYQTN
jgi:D-alanine-D-alanine ligase